MDLTDYAAQLDSLLRTERPTLVAMLERRIPSRLRGTLAAEDVAQEAALEAVRSIGAFRPAGEGSMRRWVWQIARHRLCDLVRAQSRTKRGESRVNARGATDGGSPIDALPAGGTCPVHAAGESETRAALRAALAALPTSYRQALQTHYLDGLSVDEAAARMGRTPGAFLVLCNRAIKLLRERMAVPAAAAACPLAA